MATVSNPTITFLPHTPLYLGISLCLPLMNLSSGHRDVLVSLDAIVPLDATVHLNPDAYVHL